MHVELLFGVEYTRCIPSVCDRKLPRMNSSALQAVLCQIFAKHITKFEVLQMIRDPKLGCFVSRAEVIFI